MNFTLIDVFDRKTHGNNSKKWYNKNYSEIFLGEMI